MVRTRVRIAKGVYRDQYGLAAIVRVRPFPQIERRFPPGSDVLELQQWQAHTRATLLLKKRSTPHAITTRGTLEVDANKYLQRVAHLTSYKSRCSEIKAWTDHYGWRRRSSLTREDVLDARQAWLGGDDPYAPKTINHRVRALAHLYRMLDGPHAPTPCDGIPKLTEPAPQPVAVSPQTIRKVAKTLTDPKTTARFMVLASTGQRPAQLMRAERHDVDLRKRLWMVKPAKGGSAIPLALTDDMLVAWQAFIRTDAWGIYDTSLHAKRLYKAGWPRGIRPYNAKHSVGIALTERGADWEDTRAYFGHRDIKTTRIYTGRVLSRLRATSGLLAGRLGWQKKKQAG